MEVKKGSCTCFVQWNSLLEKNNALWEEIRHYGVASQMDEAKSRTILKENLLQAVEVKIRVEVHHSTGQQSKYTARAIME